MEVNSRAAWCLLSVFMVVPTKAPTPTSLASARKSPPVRYGIPRLAPGQIWVSSVPVGLEVRVGEDPRGKAIGRTPLVLKAGEAGPYVTVTIQRNESAGKLPHQLDLADFTAARTHSTAVKDEKTGKVEEVDRSITYKVRLPEKQTIIALFQTKHLALPDLARLYPSGSNFRFSDEIIRASLAQRGVSPEFIRAGIPLLHRGGKIALPSGKDWLVLEATASGQVELIDESAVRFQ
jgi:hypothetical protein